MVGHVLLKVDAKDETLNAKLKELWITKKREPIFADFIENSRNRALKEYEIDLYDRSDVVIVVKDRTGRDRPQLLNECMYMPLMGDFMTGEDGRDVFRLAITWWSGLLDELENN